MFDFLSSRKDTALDGRLLKAAENGDAAAVEDLLRQGARANARDRKSGRTAAHFAAKAGALDALTALKSHGADFNIPDEVSDIPLDLAIKARRPETVRALFELGARPVNPELRGAYDPVYRAAYAGSAEIIRILRQNGCSVNKLSSIYTKKKVFRVTPLHAAAMEGHVDCIRLLVELGAGVNRGSVTPIYWAALYRREEALRALLDAGSRVTPDAIAAARSLPHSEELVNRLQAAYRENPPSWTIRLALLLRRFPL